MLLTHHPTRYLQVIMQPTLARCAPLIAIAALLGWSAAVAADRSAPRRPNLLLMVADDLGFSDLGCYGGEIATPNLDALAADGVRWTQFYNSGRCCPSRASILTGQYPHRVGLGHMTRDLGAAGYRGRLASDAVTVAQTLRDAGYRTFLSGKWHLGTEDPTQHGFEHFYGTLVSAKTYWDPQHYLRLPAGSPRRTYPAGGFYGSDALTDQAIDFLQLAEDTPDQPWFLYLAYNAPHFPLQAPHRAIQQYVDRYQAGWDRIRRERLQRMKQLGIVPAHTELPPRSAYWDWGSGRPVENPAWETLDAARRADLARRMAIYAAMVSRMDENIGRVLQHLQRTEQSANTLVLFTSDNGACAEWNPFGFDGQSGPHNTLHAGEAVQTMGGPDTYHSVGSGWANACNTPWRLYKHYNHEGGIAAPAIAHWPAQIRRAGQLIHRPAHIIDIVPTLLSAAQIEPNDLPAAGANMALPGRALWPADDGQQGERTLFFEHEGNRAVRRGRWKLVALRNGDWQLYDIDRDRTEMHDLAAKHPERVERLRRQWDRWAEQNHVVPLPEDYGVEYLPPGRDG